MLYFDMFICLCRVSFALYLWFNVYFVMFSILFTLAFVGRRPRVSMVACSASLEVLDKALGASKGIFLEGDELTIGDLDLSVTIYHMMSTLGTSEGW